MEEKTILKLALLTALVGLITLFILTSTIKFPETNTKITKELEGETIKIKGEITEIKEFDKFSILKIKYPTYINTITFEKTELKQGDKVEITGEVEFYEGKEELMIEEIKKI